MSEGCPFMKASNDICSRFRMIKSCGVTDMGPHGPLRYTEDQLIPEENIVLIEGLISDYLKERFVLKDLIISPGIWRLQNGESGEIHGRGEEADIPCWVGKLNGFCMKWSDGGVAIFHSNKLDLDKRIGDLEN